MSGLLVVGVGPGIGLSVAKRFAREGHAVGLVARRTETLDAAARAVERLGVAVSTYQADAGEASQLTKAVTAAVEEQLPDAVVYNVGLIRPDSPGDLSPEEHLRAWSVNVLGAIVTADVVLPRMAERGSGTYVITGGMPEPVASYLSLSLGKAGVRSVTAMLADHYGPAGVHVATVTVAGTVAPGSAFDPDEIADEYWRLHTQPRERWETEARYAGTVTR